MRRFILLAISSLFLSSTAFAGDRFEVLSNDDLNRSGLKLELDYASDVPDDVLANVVVSALLFRAAYLAALSTIKIAVMVTNVPIAKM